MNCRLLSILCLTVLFFLDTVYAQCSADAGNDLSICDGDGSSSNYTYLDGSGSTVSDGDVNYEWTVLNSYSERSIRNSHLHQRLLIHYHQGKCN